MSRAPRPLLQLVIGRAADCDVVLDHPTVSSRHARLVASGEGLVLEDLGSTNGTFVAGARVTQHRVDRGADVRIGEVVFPWSHPRVVGLVRNVGRRGTLVMTSKPAARTSRVRAALGFLLGVGLGLGLLYAAFGWTQRRATPGASARSILPSLPEVAEVVEVPHIGRARAQSIAGSIDSSDAVTRNTAVKIAASEDGPFHVEQVARLWTHVRGRWRYVNDPRGNEYFAKASETITNDFAGDCDDFAIVLAAMVTAVGGEARVVVMNSQEGGHAYAEACIRMTPEETAQRLGSYYRRKWDRYLGRQRVDRIHFRTTDACPIWLNLDWSAGVPGGPYVDETWAVAVTPDGDAAVIPAGRSDTPRSDAGSSRVPSR